MTGVIDARSPHGLFPDGDLPRASFETPHSSPLDWARRRRSDRDSRRGELASGRAATRLARLGEGWRVLDIQEIGLLNPNTFLAIGPGGVFVVVVKQQGRSRVRLAGDVVQIDGKRPQYIAEAKRVAAETSKALSRTAGNTIPVTPIVAFAGTGAIDVHGLPRGCIVTPYRELDHRANRLAHVLEARGIGPGDHVALALRNGHEYLEAMLACFKQRAVPVNVNTRYTGDELRHLLADAGARLVLHDADLADRLLAADPGLERLERGEPYERALAGTDLNVAGIDFQVEKEEFERQFIINALKRFHGRINQTVAHANIPKNTLLRKIRKYDIKAWEYGAEESHGEEFVPDETL